MLSLHPGQCGFRLSIGVRQLCAIAFAFLFVSVETATATITKAQRADDFVESTGVCVHWNYTDTVYGSGYSTLKQKLIELGVRHVRDGGGSDLFALRVRDLATNGIRTTLTMDPGAGIVPNQNYWSPSKTTRYLLTDFIKNKLGTNAVSGVEIMNEIDLFYSRDGFISDPTQAGYFWKPNNTSTTNKLVSDSTSPVWWGNYIKAITKDTYTVLKADPATAAIPVIGPSLGKSYGYDTKSPLGVNTLSNYVDWGCFHPYPGGNPFADTFSYATINRYIWYGGQPSANIDEYQYAFSIYQPPFGNKPMCATETGYFTGTAYHSVAETNQAKYVPRLFLEYFRKGIPRTCIYELVDLGANLADDQANRGLLRNDLTPKPAFTALKNLLTLLSDKGPAFTLGSLDYSIVITPPAGYNRTQYVRNMLFQKRDGTFWIVLYHEIANTSSTALDGSDISGTTRSISHPDIPVTVTFGTPVKTVKSYRPNDSVLPISTNLNPTTMTVQVRDTPLLLRVVTMALANTRPTVQVSRPPALPATTMQLRIKGSPDQNYVVQSSSNLATWSSLVTNTVQDTNSFLYTDSASPAKPALYYRVVRP